MSPLLWTVARGENSLFIDSFPSQMFITYFSNFLPQVLLRSCLQKSVQTMCKRSLKGWRDNSLMYSMYSEDTAGSVPDHHNKMGIIVKIKMHSFLCVIVLVLAVWCAIVQTLINSPLDYSLSSQNDLPLSSPDSVDSLSWRYKSHHTLLCINTFQKLCTIYRTTSLD